MTCFRSRERARTSRKRVVSSAGPREHFAGGGGQCGLLRGGAHKRQIHGDACSGLGVEDRREQLTYFPFHLSPIGRDAGDGDGQVGPKLNGVRREVDCRSPALQRVRHRCGKVRSHQRARVRPGSSQPTFDSPQAAIRSESGAGQARRQARKEKGRLRAGG